MIAAVRPAGIAVALGVTFALARLSTMPVRPSQDGEAMLRLTWSARPDRLETCRPETEEEREHLPVHMRQKVVCTGESAEYRLQVRRNSETLVDELVHGGGWRRDRPLYVYQEIPQPQGSATISVVFERIDPTPVDGATLRAGDTRLASELPPKMSLEQEFSFRAGMVVLVTYDEQRQTLVPLTSGAR